MNARLSVLAGTLLLLAAVPALAQMPMPMPMDHSHHMHQQDAPQKEPGAPPPDMGEMGSMTGMMEDRIRVHAIVEQFEARLGSGSSAFRYDGHAWIGTDTNKLWLKSEGTLAKDGKFSDGSHEVLYDRAISTFFDLQAGLRVDLDHRGERNWGAFGIQGLAPYFFEVEAMAYASDQGRLAAKLKGSYDLLLTQRLILQPSLEMNFYSKDDRARGVGAGFADLDAGLRLRYEITRKLAPYLGVSYDGRYGQTARYAQREHESTGELRFLVGVRAWF